MHAEVRVESVRSSISYQVSTSTKLLIADHPTQTGSTAEVTNNVYTYIAQSNRAQSSLYGKCRKRKEKKG